MHGIKKCASEAGITEYMLLLSVFMILLKKYSRQDDIVVGTPIAGRTTEETEKMVGMFVNTIPMRGFPSDKKTVTEFLAEMKEKCLQSYENQDYPFEGMIELADLKRDVSRNPIFDVMFAMQDYVNHEFYI